MSASRGDSAVLFTLGRVRLSVTSTTRPVRYHGLSQDLVAVLKTPEDQRTPEQKAAAAERIAQLPRSPTFLVSASRDLFFWIVCGAFAILSVMLWWVFRQPVWAGVVSLLLAPLLVWQLVFVMETRS